MTRSLVPKEQTGVELKITVVKEPKCHLKRKKTLHMKKKFKHKLRSLWPNKKRPLQKTFRRKRKKLEGKLIHTSPESKRIKNLRKICLFIVKTTLKVQDMLRTSPLLCHSLRMVMHFSPKQRKSMRRCSMRSSWQQIKGTVISFTTSWCTPQELIF